jgi:hypothetical protein
MTYAQRARRVLDRHAESVEDERARLPSGLRGALGEERQLVAVDGGARLDERAVGAADLQRARRRELSRRRRVAVVEVHRVRVDREAELQHDRRVARHERHLRRDRVEDLGEVDGGQRAQLDAGRERLGVTGQRQAGERIELVERGGVDDLLEARRARR